MKLLFKNYEKISKEINLDLNLRPQNISVNKFLEICKIYEDQFSNFLICFFMNKRSKDKLSMFLIANIIFL